MEKDELVVEDMTPEITSQQNGGAVQVPTMDAIATLIHSFASMIAGMETRLANSQDKMEGRLSDKIKENATAAEGRWTRWESDFKEYRQAMDTRVGVVEAWQDDHLAKTRAWLQSQRDDEIRQEARVKPILSAGQYIVKNWRTILLVIVSVLAVLGFAGDNIHTFLSIFGAN